MVKYFVILFTFILAVSCEKEIKLSDEDVQPRIVVNGIMRSNDTIRLHISESRPVLYDSILPNIIGANVNLLDENDNVLANFINEGEGFYRVDLITPIVGNTYKINVSANGLAPVFASTTVPQAVAISVIDTMFMNDEMTYDIYFLDDANKKNYYELSISTVMSYYEPSIMDTVYIYNTGSCSKEIFIQNGNADINGLKCEETFLFSDESFNGQLKKFTCSHNFFGDYDSTVVIIELKNLNQDFYKYKVSRSLYQETQFSPFAQPVQVYSNVENGIGIFGAYSYDSDTLF